MEFYGRPFEKSTIGKIGIEILKRLNSIHDLEVLHNDFNYFHDLLNKNNFPNNTNIKKQYIKIKQTLWKFTFYIFRCSKRSRTF